MASVKRVEIWSDVQANGGVMITPLAQLLSLTEQRSILGEHTISLTTAFDHPAVRTVDTPSGKTNFAINKVLRLRLDDNSWTEHRIATAGTDKRGSGRTRTLVARSIQADLGFRGTVARTTADGRRTVDFEALSLTPKQHIEAFVLPALIEGGESFWRVGTMAATKPVDIVYGGNDADTPLSALHKIRVAAGNLELGTRGFPSTTRYFLDLLTQVGRTTFPAVVRSRKNLVDLGFKEVSDDQATRISCFGAPTEEVRPSVGFAEWVIESHKSTADGISTMKLIDPAGGPGPIAFDDQFVGYYLWGLTTNPLLVPILTTSAARQEVTLPFSTFGGFIGERVKIVASAAKTDVLYVDHPESVKPENDGVRVAHLDRSDIPGTNNVMSNSVMRLWPASASVPTGWPAFFAGVVVTRNTDPRFWRHGGQSARVRFTSTAGIWSTPQDSFNDDAQGLASFFVGILVVSGLVRVSLELILKPGVFFDGANGPSNGVTVPDDLPGYPDPNLAPPVVNTVTGAFTDLGIANAWDLTKYPVRAVRVKLRPDPSTPNAECYWDTVQVTNSNGQMPLLEGNGGVRLHQAANERLAIYHRPATPISVSLVDLTAVDGTQFPYDGFSLGGMVRILDKEGDMDAMTRIVGWSRDWFDRSNLKLQISDERKDITTVLATQSQNTRHQTYAR